MKLIGAKDKFVRAPFVVEGVFIGLIGSIIPLVLLFFLYQGIVSYVSERFKFIGDLVSFRAGRNRIYHLGSGIAGTGYWYRLHWQPNDPAQTFAGLTA